MAGNGYYPPEYGIEVGERCGRGNCSGRMVTDKEYCICCYDGMDEAGMCPVDWIVVCSLCGSSPRYD